MAILINQDVSISGGISLNQIYLRIDYFADLSGKSLNSHIYPYISKGAFSLNWQENILRVDNLPTEIQYGYDSSINGDPLFYIHDRIKETLSTDIYRTDYVIDPSTGFVQVDPSTGEMVTQQILVKPKFADESNIIFSDLD